MAHYDPLHDLYNSVWQSGGFVNSHAHFDRAYTVTEKNMKDVVYNHLHQKWKYIDDYKLSATEKDFRMNIQNALLQQRDMATTHCLSFIDIDPVVGYKAVDAAVKAKEYANAIGINFKIACQTLKGVLPNECQVLLADSLERGAFDVIGSLPGADKGEEEKHIEHVLFLGKAYNKRVHVHVDQLNTSTEKETELLARKTIQAGMEGKVTAVHSISLACHPKWYRKEVYKICQDAGLSFVACPTAWIDARRTEEIAPIHNAVTPVDELIENNLIVALGSDNIHDVYKPYSTGDMKVELKFLLEATHIYNKDILIKIARDNGLEVCGFNEQDENRNFGGISHICGID